MICCEMVFKKKMTIFNHLNTFDYHNFILLIFGAYQTRYFKQLQTFLCLEKHILKMFYDFFRHILACIQQIILQSPEKSNSNNCVKLTDFVSQCLCKYNIKFRIYFRISEFLQIILTRIIIWVKIGTFKIFYCILKFQLHMYVRKQGFISAKKSKYL